MKNTEYNGNLQPIDEGLLGRVSGGEVCICANSNGASQPSRRQAAECLRRGDFNYGNPVLLERGWWQKSGMLNVDFFRPEWPGVAHSSESACRQTCSSNRYETYFWLLESEL